ncbi:MAG: DUF6036 family nucleotidyltransferase [Polyangia bacterium]
MSYLALDRELLLEALACLDERMETQAHLVIGGGAAMVASYDHPLATRDIDAMAVEGSPRISDLERPARRVAAEIGLEPDWLNPYFETYAAVLPADYGSRLRSVYRGERLRVDSLGPEDLLVMKCFAGRDKDLAHARRLIRIADDLEIVDRQLTLLSERGYPGSLRAADYFDDLRDELEP